MKAINAGKCVLCCVFAVICVLRVGAQTKRAPTIDESISLKQVGGALISPDGKFVVYGVSETCWKDNDYISQLWLADTASGRTFQLTRGKKSTGSAAWSPDGRWLAFVTEREPYPSTAVPEKKDDKADAKTAPEADGKPAARQIWLISPTGGEAWQLTQHGSNVGAFRWSKDGRQIAFIAEVPESKSFKERKDKYGDFQVPEKDYSQNQLWLVDVSAAEKTGTPVKARRLSGDASLSIGDFNWSPDSTRIAFSATANPLLAFSREADIYLLDVAGNVVHKIVALPGPEASPVFSPDGKQLAVTTSLGSKWSYYQNTHIAIVNLETALARPVAQASDLRDLTAKFDEDAQLIDWGADGIYFSALQKTTRHVFRISPATGTITRLTGPDNFIFLGSVSFTKDFKTMAFTATDAQHMSELFISPTGNFQPRKLTDMNAQLAGFALGSVELVSWKSGDGTVIDGVLHKPADFDPQKKYPLMVIIHGGPTGVSRPVLLQPEDRVYPIQLFLSKGALVLQPNYRGSAGYGEAFRSLNVRNLGLGDMMDVMSGVDELIARGLVDPERLAAMGWSQGGYISAFLTTHTDRFKAISVGAGISDWMTYYVSTDITPFTRQYLQATPWDDPDIYARTSPMSTIKQAKTPTLIQQGDGDRRVPVSNAFQLYRGLQDQNVPSRLLLYTGFGHLVNKPKSNRALMQANLDWFSHYIWGEPIPKDSPLYGSGESVTEPK